MERNKYSDMTDAQVIAAYDELKVAIDAQSARLFAHAAQTGKVKRLSASEKLLGSDFSAINIEYSRRLYAARSKSGMTMAGEMARFIGR
jgi:hypothetical protein